MSATAKAKPRSDKFKGMEVHSTHGYLSGYKQPASIEAQIDILRSHWPMLNPDGAIRYAREVYPTLQVPDWVEGPFVNIRPKFFSDNYGEEVTEIISALANSLDGEFFNYHPLQMKCLRQCRKTAASYKRITQQQGDSDLLIVGGQFGIRHRGRSVRRAREVIKSECGEFSLGTASVGTMLITHPNRLQDFCDLWIDCSGDEYDHPFSNVRFGCTPYFFLFNDEYIRLELGMRDGSHDLSSSPTGFVSKN